MENKPFVPTPEPEMPQYVQSISDHRARNQNGSFISHEAVQNAHETYDQEKAAWDTQEADRIHVYENAAALPEDLDVSTLTASDLKEKLGITYQQALELQDTTSGTDVRELVQAARDWKAGQPETEAANEEAPEAEQKDISAEEGESKPTPKASGTKVNVSALQELPTSVVDESPEAQAEDLYVPRHMKKESDSEAAEIPELPPFLEDERVLTATPQSDKELAKGRLDADEAFDTLPEFLKGEDKDKATIKDSTNAEREALQFDPQPDEQQQAILDEFDKAVAEGKIEDVPDGVDVDELMARLNPETTETSKKKGWRKFGRSILDLLSGAPVPADQLNKNAPAYQAQKAQQEFQANAQAQPAVEAPIELHPAAPKHLKSSRSNLRRAA